MQVYKHVFQRFYFLVAVATIAASSFAQTAKTSAAVEANLRRHVEVLASDKFEGRRAGEPGANAAGEYVAAEFRKLKLQPGVSGINGKLGYKQSFSYSPVRDPHSAPGDPTSTPALPNAKQA